MKAYCRALCVFFLYSPMLLAADTVLKLYRPFGDVMDQIAPVITTKLHGHCEGQSHLIVREDAWHCQAKGVVYDPCFAKMSKELVVICPKSPWNGDSTQITVTTPLNNERHHTLDMSQALPWAIELVTGTRCQAVEPGEEYDNMPVRYRCGEHQVLMGYLQRCKPQWSMLEKNPQGVVTVALAKAWF